MLAVRSVFAFSHEKLHDHKAHHLIVSCAFRCIQVRVTTHTVVFIAEPARSRAAHAGGGRHDRAEATSGLAYAGNVIVARPERLSAVRRGSRRLPIARERRPANAAQTEPT